MARFLRRNRGRKARDPDLQASALPDFGSRRYPGIWRISISPSQAEDTPWIRIVYLTALGAIKNLVDNSSRLLVLAAVWYGLLTISYDRFYSPLGVGLGDVGLSYSTILASSVGAAAAVLAYTLLPIAALGILLGVAKLLRNESTTSAIRRITPSFMLAATIGAAVIVGLILLPTGATRQVELVQDGCNASSLRLPGLPFSVLSIGASRVEVISIANPVPSSVTAQDILYLGQANGTLVLYRYTERVPVYTPSRDITINRLPAPRCE